MGTNYFAEITPNCAHCGSKGERLHIGKSSGGWCFSLRVYIQGESESAEGIFDITTLDEWYEYLSDKRVFDEYDNECSLDVLRDVIENRQGSSEFDKPYERDTFRNYASWKEFHSRNHSEPGPRGLLRHQIGFLCIGHGSGTWDYMHKEFS